MRNVAVTLVGLSVSLLAGCGQLDPWGEFNVLPESHGRPFAARFEATGAADDPLSLPPDLAGRMLSLGECVAIALEQNPRTAESWQALRAAAARSGRAKAEYLPMIGFTSSAARGETVDLGRASDSGVRSRYDGVFGLRWLIFDGGGREARVDAGTAEVLATGFRHNAALQDVAVATIESYYHLLASVSLRQLAEQTLRQRDHHLRMAQARYEAGVVSRLDVLRSETEKADAELSLVRARNAVETAHGRLATWLGISVNTRFEIEELDKSHEVQHLGDIALLLQEAADNRPELKTALAEIHRQEATVRLAQSRYWPAIAANTGLGWLGRSFPPDQRQWNLGLAVDLPLFTGFDRNYQIHTSRAELDRATAARRGALQGVELEVWTAYWQVVEATQAIEAAERFVASAEESARVAEGEYRQGTASMLEVIDAQTRRTGAQDRLIQTRLDGRTAIARLEHALGRSLAHWSNSLPPGESEQP